MHHRSFPASLATSVALGIAGLLILFPAPAAHATDSDALPGSGRVVLVPPNLGVRAAAEVEPGLEPVWREFLGHFSGQKRPASALERNSATALWNEVVREVRSDGGDVYDAYALFAPTGARWEAASATEWIARLPAGKHYVAAAVLPDDKPESVSLLLRHAYAFVQGTRVQWRYDPAAPNGETTPLLPIVTRTEALATSSDAPLGK